MKKLIVFVPVLVFALMARGQSDTLVNRKGAITPEQPTQEREIAELMENEIRFKAIQYHQDMNPQSSYSERFLRQIDGYHSGALPPPQETSEQGLPTLWVPPQVDQSDLQKQVDALLMPLSAYIDKSEEDKGIKIKTIVAGENESDAPVKKRKYIPGPTQYDSRIELRLLNPSVDWELAILKNAASVAIVVERSKLHALTDSLYQLDVGATLGELYSLCPGEPFSGQPVIGVGTAFVVGENTMMTAAHVFEGNLHDYVIIFGFEMVNQVGAYEKIIHRRDVFFPAKAEASREDLDLVLFRVDRPLNRSPFSLSLKSGLKKGTPVYMIGHPTGLPKKVALNASILSSDNAGFYYTTLDSFQGNSGSPVFDLETNEVIGVLVSGMVDYAWNGSCNYSALCKPPYCLGEKVIRINGFLESSDGLEYRTGVVIK